MCFFFRKTVVQQIAAKQAGDSGMKLSGKVYGVAATGLALLAMSGTASALTYQGAEFTASAAGSGTTWLLTLNMDFTNADANNEFLGDMMESWSLTMPGTGSVSMSPDFGGDWNVYGVAQTDACGCGQGQVNSVCADWGTRNVLDGGGPVIGSAFGGSDTFSFTVQVIFDNAIDDLNAWTGNFHLLSVREFTRGCGQAESCIKKDGGLISQPLGVPEPGSLALLGLGLVGLGLSRRRRA